MAETTPAKKAASSEPKSSDDSGTLTDVEKASQEAAEARLKADQALEKEQEDARKKREEEVKKVQSDTVETDDKGRPIGIDGENPVSNVNPDPRSYGR